MIELGIAASSALLAGLAGWRLHRLTTPPPAPAPSVKLRRTTVHEDWDIVGAAPPPVLDRTYASPLWGAPELENR